MEEVKQDVQVEPSTTETQEVVNTETPTTSEQPIDEGQNQAVDETGVPIFNREMEWKRKYNELADSIPRYVAEEVNKINSTKEQKQKYTVSQLEAYAIENPEYRPWVEEQKEQLRKEELANIVESRLSAEKKQAEDTRNRNQAFAFVAQNYPDLFLKDSRGNQMWNEKNPVVGDIANYMRDPELAKRPDGIMIATKLAMADHYRTSSVKATVKAKLAESALKKEQLKNMVDGTGAGSVEVKTPYQKAVDRLKERYDKSSAKDAVKEILKAQGMIKE